MINEEQAEEFAAIRSADDGGDYGPVASHVAETLLPIIDEARDLLERIVPFVDPDSRPPSVFDRQGWLQQTRQLLALTTVKDRA